MILVTGASGLLGASLVKLAQEQRRKVVGLYHRNPIRLPGVSLVRADLTQESEIRRLFSEISPTVVMHCAAETRVDWCEENPDATREINVGVSQRIAEITATAGSQMLHISTDSVFDGVCGGYAETDQPAPVNIYAQTKLEAERAVLGSNPRAAVARINMYGWNLQPKQSIAEWILGQLTQGREVPGFTDVIFCPILANDLAEILLAMTDDQLAGTYHVVGSERVSKYEFGRRVASTFGFDPAKVVPARLGDARLKAPRPFNTSLNTEKICAALTRSMPDVDSGLKRFAELRSAYANSSRSVPDGVAQ
jgi:dTDP-4-dehydrorhamnose reductase